MTKKTAFEQFLDRYDETAWTATITELLPEIHEVDRNAVQIWFRFYPLELFRLLETVEDKTGLARKLDLQGKYLLAEQIDDSHRFLYGHRFWETVKDAIIARAIADEPTTDLATEIKQIARIAALKTTTAEPLVIAIAAVGLMTLVQVGFDKLKAASGKISIDQKHLKLTAQQVLQERAKDDSAGVFGFLKSTKQWTVTHDETNARAKFKVINDEEIASAAARDQSEKWLEKDERCIEGVIPVECRSAACGTCWVGVLGGAEKLSNATAREQKSMRRFGYLFSDEPKPILRLACQAQAAGAVSIVIPPWNGVFGKFVNPEKFVEETLEPATTSAKATRTVLKEATKNQLM